MSLRHQDAGGRGTINTLIISAAGFERLCRAPTSPSAKASTGATALKANVESWGQGHSPWVTEVSLQDPNPRGGSTHNTNGR